jgi:DNA replication initiation complex subunit (GINS family)
MIDYNEIYDLLRKEKYSELLQPLPKNFVLDISEYFEDKKSQSLKEENLFADSALKSKKHLENAISIFKELIRMRKKKLLNLVFVATETGMMKRDYENMLSYEKEVFDKIVKTIEDGDKELAKNLNGEKENKKERNRMILLSQNVEQFVDMEGNVMGPFEAGQLANLAKAVSEILVSSGKARFVDED